MRFGRVAIVFVIGWYFLLIAAHWLGQRPLWNDEQVVFLSIQSFTSFEFFHRILITDQAFPRVYLWLIRQFSEPFGFSLLSLRFFSFISMVMAFAIWVRISCFELKAGRLVFLFLFSWVASIPLVYYAAELKQYSMDVCAAAVFLLFLYRQSDLSAGPCLRYCLILFVLPVLGLFSYPVFLFFILPFWHLVQMVRRDRRQFLPLVVYAVACCLVFFFSQRFDVKLCSQTIVLTYNDHFIYFDSLKSFTKSFFEGLNDLVARWFSSKPVWIRGVSRVFMTLGLVEMFIGAWVFFRRPSIVLSLQVISFGIFLELVLLGALHRYPFSVTRTSLFFCPILFLLTMQLFGRLEQRYRALSLVLQVIYGSFLLFFACRVTVLVMTKALGNG